MASSGLTTERTSARSSMSGSLSNKEISQERKALARRRRASLFLVAPLLAFIFFSFVAPIASMLYRSVYNPAVVELIPETLAELSEWDGDGLPSDATRSAMARELRGLAQERRAGVLAAAVNRAYPGASSLINSTARKMRNLKDEELRNGDALLDAADKRWTQTELWRAIDEVGAVYTDNHYLTALDLERNAAGGIQQRESARIYLQLYGKTLGMALVITLLCIVLGYPLAWYLSQAPARKANMLMIFVLLPFWTSLLLRTTAWSALLQTNGVVNSVLQPLYIIVEPLELLYTRVAPIIAMPHILLPFMILPLYSVMRGLDPSYMRAALS